MEKAVRLSKRIVNDESGSIAPIFGLMIVPMLGMLMISIDLSRGQQVHDRMQEALDGAVLAAMRNKDATLQQKVDITKNFFAANFSSPKATDAVGDKSYKTSVNRTGVVKHVEPEVYVEYYDDPSKTKTHLELITAANVAAHMDSSKTATQTGKVTAKATANLKTFFGRVYTNNEITLKSNTTVKEATSTGQKLELAMMVDLTGSMGQTRNGMTKLAGLKLAGTDLLNIIYPNGDNANARVGIAPMADYVNAGSYAAKATGLSPTGSYAKSTNLAQTKQGPFSGTYSGYYGSSASNQPTGSQFGCTSSNSSSSGATYSNTYCTSSDPSAYETYSGKPVGTWAFWNTPGAVWQASKWYTKQWKYDDKKWEYDDHDGGTYIVKTRSSTCAEAADQSGQLISCVTERTSVSSRYTDDYVSSGNYVGPYNQTSLGSTNKLNYSSDGKCMVGGRELPEVIPLTSSKATLQSFFDNATAGGATPGHLGHAWSWYLLSPKWASLWPSTATPAAYNDTKTKKVAVIMTDGEYNTQYSNVASRTQALELCKSMKASGIEVYTVGFGFSASSAAGDNTSEGNAKDLLTQCSSGTNHYYFPYDSAALRSVFQNIGNGLMGNTTNTTAEQITQ